MKLFVVLVHFHLYPTEELATAWIALAVAIVQNRIKVCVYVGFGELSHNAPATGHWK